MTEVLRGIANESANGEEIEDKAKTILKEVVREERYAVGGSIANGRGGAISVEQGQVEESNASHEEGKEVVDGIEAYQSTMGDGVTSSESGHNRAADERNGGEEGGNDRGTS